MSKNLLYKNTLFLLRWLPLVLVLFCILFYFLMRMQAHHMQEKQLLLKQQNIWNAFTKKMGAIETTIPGEYIINEGVSTDEKYLDEPRDTVIYFESLKKAIPFEALTGQFQWNGKVYNVTTFVSSTEINHLIIKVFITEALILLLLLLTIVFLNRKSSRRLWQPFFATINKMDEYDVTKNTSLDIPKETGTIEFNRLNNELNKMIARVNNAYYNQKQFVENASHEIQTPLSIIRSKLELLINQPDLTKKSASLLGDITEANDRLSQMNKTLLLLAKIENNQFPDVENISLSQLLQDGIVSFQQHYEEKFPSLTLDIDENVSINANKVLIEILLSNLIKNAIEHNVPGGFISVKLKGRNLYVENTGAFLEGNPEELFERFKKSSYQSKTTGLGLALVKQVTLLYHYELSYQHDKGIHEVKIKFK
ncbi:MAG: HAMP domain-containing histidine kinase [Segetibacter sp.]|nr:HAMP domain-containing histidine kinase [Segetibacter sp.]